MDLWGILNNLVPIAALALGGYIARRLTKQSSKDKAELLARIAADGARLLILANPAAKWPELMRMLIAQTSQAAGLNVTDKAAIERAAASALWDAGIRP